VVEHESICSRHCVQSSVPRTEKKKLTKFATLSPQSPRGFLVVLTLGAGFPSQSACVRYCLVQAQRLHPYLPLPCLRAQRRVAGAWLVFIKLDLQ
jgi:hypothetical protein